MKKGPPSMLRHFLNLFELNALEAHALVDHALEMKQRTKLGHRSGELAGRVLGLLFEKPSLRTRVSFEAAMAHLGGSAVFLTAKEVGLGVRETVADFARILSQYVDALAVRTYHQQTVEDLARHATIPVINALSDTAHPCQAMADLMTVKETLGRTEGVRAVFIGDGNNVARSLAIACALLGARFRLCGPAAHRFPEEFVDSFSAAFPDIPLEMVSGDPREAVHDAEVIYTDVWTSMGQEAETDTRRKIFEPYRVDEALLNAAQPNVMFLHCLPAHRGEEVTSGVLDGPRSHVVQQAGNRLHFQKALLLWLLAGPMVGIRHADRAAARIDASRRHTHPRRRYKTG
jgi:ornithine carbamoyltransferase